MTELYDKTIFEKYKMVIESLEDELSQTVFQYRLLFNIADDERYIYKLIKETKCVDISDAIRLGETFDEEFDGMFKSKDVMSFLQDRMGKIKKVVLFGAGEQARNYLSLLGILEIEPEIILDNSKVLPVLGINVKKPSEYEDIRESLIIISVCS